MNVGDHPAAEFSTPLVSKAAAKLLEKCAPFASTAASDLQSDATTTTEIAELGAPRQPDAPINVARAFRVVYRVLHRQPGIVRTGESGFSPNQLVHAFRAPGFTKSFARLVLAGHATAHLGARWSFLGVVAKVAVQGAEQFGPPQQSSQAANSKAPPVFDLHEMKARWDSVIRHAFSRRNFLPSSGAIETPSRVRHLWPLWEAQRERAELELSAMLFESARLLDKPPSSASAKSKGARATSAKRNRRAVSFVIGHLVMRMVYNVAAFDHRGSWVDALMDGIPAATSSHLLGSRRPGTRSS